MSDGWNYRVVRQTVHGETLYGIHEAYYEGTSWTEKPVAPVAESVAELRDVLAKMATAPESDVIDGGTEPDDATKRTRSDNLARALDQAWQDGYDANTTDARLRSDAAALRGAGNKAP